MKSLKYGRQAIARFKLNRNGSDTQGFDKLNERLNINNPGQISAKIDVAQNLNLKPGSSAPLAYTGQKVFPDWYRPYLSNYYGHGFLISFFIFASAVCYVQYEQYLLRTGRKSVQNYRDEHFLYNTFNLRRVLEKENRENTSIPIFNYVRRYIKESGF